jgi:Zn-dependent peptidase ImmA (M78 family)
MLHMILLATIIFYDPSVNLTPYMDVLLTECHVRIDIVNRSNNYYDGYAWYSGRIIIYDGNINMKGDSVYKKWVLAHEIGHVCAGNNRRGNYIERERLADEYAYNKTGVWYE